jgi:hypothetical protein
MDTSLPCGHDGFTTDPADEHPVTRPVPDKPLERREKLFDISFVFENGEAVHSNHVRGFQSLHIANCISQLLALD